MLHPVIQLQYPSDHQDNVWRVIGSALNSAFNSALSLASSSLTPGYEQTLLSCDGTAS